MSLSLRGRMVMTAVAAAGIALAVVLAVAGPRLEARARQDATATLMAEARLMARVVEDSLAQGTRPEALDPVMDEAAREVNARVTVIAPDGRVLADSALSGPALLAMENHGGRPEVRAALADHAASVERQSATVSADLLYAAVPVHHQGRVVGVARLSRGIESIRSEGRRLWWAATLALSLALVATGLLSLALLAPLGRALEQIMEAARQFAHGNLSARTDVRRGDELGELARIINQAADEQQQRLAELARDRARTDAILRALDDGVLAVDHQGTVLLANARLAEAMELGAPLGRHYLEVIRQSEIAALIEEVLRSGERCQAEVELLRLGRVYAITGVAFPGAEATPHGAVLTFNDATERHRIEHMRRDFVANASHELRTPLTSIRGFVEALEDGALEEPATARRFLAKVRTHADRMTALVDDLLELSRIEQGDRAPQWSATRAQDVVEMVRTSFEDLAAGKQISLMSRDLGCPTVVSDPDRLRRILENLVDNAVKYTPAGGRIEITASAGSGGDARIEVCDNGPGIAREHLGRIFERFYRVDKARSRELGGTGLGLSIVKHLAEGMGASVSVESELGRGSRFVVLLPARPEIAAKTPAD
jgi:two-component system, OmpR family, phosphate regulon sensor histidine kinase PhoR